LLYLVLMVLDCWWKYQTWVFLPFDVLMTMFLLLIKSRYLPLGKAETT
jgi:hypothetical protein